MSWQEPQLIPCKRCGHMIVSNAQICPYCGARNATPWHCPPWLIAIIVVLVIGVIGGVVRDDTTPKSAAPKPVRSTAGTTDSSKNSDVSEPESTPENAVPDLVSSTADTTGSSVNSDVNEPESTPEPGITYTPYEVGQLIDELDENALRTADKHKGEYVELTGKLDVIDSSGKYISIERTDSEYSFLDDIRCDIKSEEQKSVVRGLSTGDVIVVKGKITDVGEIMGYSLNIDEIYLQ